MLDLQTGDLALRPLALQIRTVAAEFFEGHFAAPAADLFVVAAERISGMGQPRYSARRA
jgi:hypothetical protein